MFDIDWTNLQMYHYLAFGGGGVAVLAIILYFVLPRGFQIPAGVLGTVGGLIAGAGIGVIGMAAFGYQLKRESDDAAVGPEPKAIPAVGDPKGKKMGFGAPGGGKGFGGKGGAKGGAFTISDKVQLASLVTKLHQLTEKPLTLKLTDEQRTVIREQLKDLTDQEELSNEDAKKRLDAILEAVKDSRPTLEAAGYIWPGSGFNMPQQTPNPFKEGPQRDRLTALQEALKK